MFFFTCGAVLLLCSGDERHLFGGLPGFPSSSFLNRFYYSTQVGQEPFSKAAASIGSFMGPFLGGLLYDYVQLVFILVYGMRTTYIDDID